MKIQTQDYDEITVIDLQGDLDSEVTEMFQNNITQVMTKCRTGIVLDMNNVGFIDSEGLERLLWLRDYCIENNCQLRLAGLDENCEKILEITQLADEFDRYKELSGAVKSFA